MFLTDKPRSILRYIDGIHINVVKVVNGRRSQMADGHLGLGSNVQLGLVDFKVCDWPPETSLHDQSQTLISCWPIKTSLSWLITEL